VGSGACGPLFLSCSGASVTFEAMSPSRGDGPEEIKEEAVREARASLRRLLDGLHVLDALPERSRMLAVDAELPVHAVLSMVLAEQHPQPTVLKAAPGPDEQSQALLRAPMRREGQMVGGLDPDSGKLFCGVVSPILPSNVLAEVCGFEVSSASQEACDQQQQQQQQEQAAAQTTTPAPSQSEDNGLDRQPSVRRQWTSVDDGWGMHLSSIPMQDLAKMPMGMPVSVGELADFLSRACPSSSSEDPSSKQTKNGSEESGRWADPVSGAPQDASSKDKEGDPSSSSVAGTSSSSMLDWSLAHWRAERLKRQDKAKGDGDSPTPSVGLCVEDRPRIGPVVVHQVPSAPPRPILCIDDPEASILKAVQLLLAYPELDALPIVCRTRCTVVAHLTLSYCLAYILPRMRGADLLPLGDITVKGSAVGTSAFRKFDSKAAKSESWAEKLSEVGQAPLVLTQQHTVRDLLVFFVNTSYSSAPIVEENGSGGLLGLVSRRDLLNYLDLGLQTVKRTGDTSRPLAESEAVKLDLGLTMEGLLAVLRRCRRTSLDEAPSAGFGGGVVDDKKELSLKAAILSILDADNRKLLFVEDSGATRKLKALVAATDLWRLLLGNDQDFPLEPVEAPQPLESQDL